MPHFPSCSTGGGGGGSGFLGTRVRRLAIRSRAGCNGTWARSVAGGVRVGDASAGGEGCSLTLTGSTDSLQRLLLTATSRHGTGRAEGGASAGRGGAGFAGERHPGTRALRCTRSPTGVRRELGASSLPVPSAYGAPGRGRQTSGRRRRHPSCHVTEGRPSGGRLLGGGNGANGWTCPRIARLMRTLCHYGKARAGPHYRVKRGWKNRRTKASYNVFPGEPLTSGEIAPHSTHHHLQAALQLVQKPLRGILRDRLPPCPFNKDMSVMVAATLP